MQVDGYKKAEPLLRKQFKVVQSISEIYTGGKVIVSKHEEIIACTCGEKVNIVDFKNGNIVRTFEGDGSIVTSIALNPNNQELAVCSRSLSVRLYNLTTGVVRQSFKTNSPVLSLCYDPSGSLLVTGMGNGSIKIYDVEESYLTHQFTDHSGVVSYVCFHPHINKKIYLYSAATDNTLRVWDLEARTCLAVLRNHNSVVTAIEFSPDGDYMLTAGRDRIMNLFQVNLRNGEHTCVKTFPVFESIETMALLPANIALPIEEEGNDDDDENEKLYVVTGGPDQELRVWNFFTGNKVYTQPKDKYSSAFKSIFACPMNRLVMGVTADHNIIFYDIDSLKRERQIVGFNDEITDIKFVANNKDKIVLATNSEIVQLIDLSTKNSLFISGHEDIVLAISTSHDGKYLVSGSKDNTVRVWELETQECIAIGKHASDVSAVAFANNSNSFFLSASEDKTIKIWNMNYVIERRKKESTEVVQLQASRTIQAHDKDINSLHVAPHDALVVSASSDRTAKVWSILQTDDDDKPFDLALAGVCHGHRKAVFGAKFSPVDKVIATASKDKTIKIFSVANFACLKTIEADSALVNLSFITNGMQIASVSTDGLLQIWTLQNDQCENKFDAHAQGKVWALSTINDGALIATGGTDSLVNIWEDCTVEEEDNTLKKQEELVLDQQRFENALLNGDMMESILVSIRTNQPRNLYRSFEKLDEMDLEAGGSNNIDENNRLSFDSVMRQLSIEDIRHCLKHAVDWNTNSKYSHIAQKVIHAIFKNYTAELIVGEGGEIPKRSIEGLLAYSERHLRRVDKLLQKSYILDFFMYSMEMLLPVRANNNKEDDSKTDATDEDAGEDGDAVAKYLEQHAAKKEVDIELESKKQDVRARLIKSVQAAVESANNNGASDEKNQKSGNKKRKNTADANKQVDDNDNNNNNSTNNQNGTELKIGKKARKSSKQK